GASPPPSPNSAARADSAWAAFLARSASNVFPPGLNQSQKFTRSFSVTSSASSSLHFFGTVSSKYTHIRQTCTCTPQEGHSSRRENGSVSAASDSPQR